MNETVLQISWRSVALACLLAACSAEEGTDVPGPDPMRLYSALENPAEEGDAVANNYPVFIFWDFGDWLSQTATPNPYLVAMPEQGIDAYIRGNAPYNTNHTYPDGNRRVVATGYAPASLVPATRGEDETEDYERLTLPKDGEGKWIGLGTTDLLTSVTPIVASAALPFDREGGETLEFMHAQAKVSFQAKLAEDMTKNIRNVRITLGSELLATRLEWNRNEEHHGVFYYSARDEAGDHTCVVGPGNTTSQLTSEQATPVGEAYIVPGKERIDVSITVERSDDVQFTDSRKVTFRATLPFTIDRHSDDYEMNGTDLKEANMLHANEAYTFTLVFGEESIELLGNKCPWEEGGYLIVPVYPLDKNE